MTPHIRVRLVAVRNLAAGQSVRVSAPAQHKKSAQHKKVAGRWVTASKPQKATRWKRVYIRSDGGLRR